MVPTWQVSQIAVNGTSTRRRRVIELTLFPEAEPVNQERVRSCISTFASPNVEIQDLTPYLNRSPVGAGGRTLARGPM
jgi:hypothetical protein